MVFKEWLKEDAKASKKKKDASGSNVDEVTSQLQFPTGFMYLDYICGNFIIPEDDNDVPICKYHNIGVLAGSVNMLIAKSQGGKSTLATEMGIGILEPWLSTEAMKRYLNPKDNPKFDYVPKSILHYIDTEKTMTADYMKKIVRLKNKTMKKHIIIDQVTTDMDLLTAVRRHVQYKEQCMQKVVFPMRDTYNEPIEMYPPTVCVIDSVTQLVLEKADGLDDEAVKNQQQNTAGAQRAKIISSIYTQLVNIGKQYNIIFFCINHINKAPNMSFMPAPKQYRGLKQEETISGGERSLYLATNILRLDWSKDIGGPKASALDFGPGVTGFIVTASFIKNKSNSFGNTCFLVYTNRRGYDPILSTLYTAKERGELTKVGNFYCLEAYPQYKFTFKNVNEVFAEHPEMILAMYLEFQKKCEKLLDNKSFDELNADKKSSCKTVDDDDDDSVIFNSLNDFANDFV